MHDVDGLNAGYARLLLEDYLENPDAVPPEWRALFESGDSELVASHPRPLRPLLHPRHRRRYRLLPSPSRPPRPSSTRNCSAASPRPWHS